MGRNNQAKYETLFNGMTLSLEVGSSNFKSKRESQMVEKQVPKEYQTNELQLVKYLKKECDLS